MKTRVMIVEGFTKEQLQEKINGHIDKLNEGGIIVTIQSIIPYSVGDIHYAIISYLE